MNIVIRALSILALAALATGQPAVAQQQGQAAASTCATCGSVASVKYVEEKGQGSGAGMVIGGVAGGVLGHQIGSGRGNTVATIAGAGVGAYAGNQVEKNAKKKSYWAVTVNLDNGKKQTVNVSSEPAFKKGDRVKIVDGNKLALLTN
jgi:outer membrane lipoprotein SlyB